MKTICASVIITLLAASTAQGQRARCQKYLDEMHAVAARDNGYGPQKIAGDEEFRCEGLFTISTSGETIELAVVSLTAGPLSYQLTPSLTLDVAVAPDVRASSQIRIRALPQKEGKNYQMDAAIRSGGRLTWPAGAILSSYGIDSSQLGVYGVAQQNGADIFVPLSVTVRGSAAPAPPQPLLLTVRYPYTLSRLGWKAGRIDVGGECVSTGTFEWIYNSEGRVPIPIKLANAEGDCLSFRLQRTSGSTSIPATIRIALPGKR